MYAAAFCAEAGWLRRGTGSEPAVINRSNDRVVWDQTSSARSTEPGTCLGKGLLHGGVCRLALPLGKIQSYVNLKVGGCLGSPPPPRLK